MDSIILWMIEKGLAKNNFNASSIVNGLRLWELKSENEQKDCVRLYRLWRGTDKKNQLPTSQAFDLARAGIDPDDVPERQIEMELAQ